MLPLEEELEGKVVDWLGNEAEVVGKDEGGELLGKEPELVEKDEVEELLGNEEGNI